MAWFGNGGVVSEAVKGFRGRIQERITLDTGPGAGARFDKQSGAYSSTWEAMQLPGPSTGNYAWSSYALPWFGITGRGYHCGAPPRPVRAVQEALPATKLAGSPIIAGGLYTAPLTGSRR